MTVNTVAPVKRGPGRPSAVEVAAREKAERDALDNARKRLPEADVIKRIGDRMEMLERITHGAAQGAISSAIASGAPGIGKTFAAEEILTAYKQGGGHNYASVSGVVTPIELYKMLWATRHNGRVLLLDDSDDVFNDEKSLNLLKAAVDTSLVRRIAYRSNSRHLVDDDGAEIPNEMTYEGAVLFLTNFDFEAYIERGINKRLTPHFEALMSRTLYLDLKIHSRYEVAVWVKHRVKTLRILEQKGLTTEQSDMVLAWMEANQDKMRSYSIRTAVLVAGFVLTWGNEWEKNANMLMLRNEV